MTTPELPMPAKSPPLILIEEGVYTRLGAWIWWRSRNKNFGGRRPVDTWFGHDDQPEDRQLVLDEISRLTGGNR